MAERIKITEEQFNNYFEIVDINGVSIKFKYAIERDFVERMLKPSGEQKTNLPNKNEMLNKFNKKKFKKYMKKLVQTGIVSDDMANRYPGSVSKFIETFEKDNCFNIAWEWYQTMYGYPYPKRNKTNGLTK